MVGRPRSWFDRLTTNGSKPLAPWLNLAIPTRPIPARNRAGHRAWMTRPCVRKDASRPLPKLVRGLIVPNAVTSHGCKSCTYGNADSADTRRQRRSSHHNKPLANNQARNHGQRDPGAEDGAGALAARRSATCRAVASCTACAESPGAWLALRTKNGQVRAPSCTSCHPACAGQ